MAQANLWQWNPSKKGAEILNKAMGHIRSVSYKVSLRWVFYRLLQEGYYTKKSYNNFVKLTSRARHKMLDDWRPDTLADETRSAIGDSRQSVGKESIMDCIEDLTASIYLNPMYGQDYYVEVWFEAKAMSGQFKKYIPDVVLRPMGGQPSIPYKWQAAKALERAYSKYHHDVIVLYFGDCDDAGEGIFDTIQTDISSWCNIPFQIIHCGLNSEQSISFGLPENPDKPGTYQWEALNDEQAKGIINGNLFKYFNADVKGKYMEVENNAQVIINTHIEELKEILLSGNDFDGMST